MSLSFSVRENYFRLICQNYAGLGYIPQIFPTLIFEMAECGRETHAKSNNVIVPQLSRFAPDFGEE